MSVSLSKLLGRKTSGGNFIPEIDGLRFFAIITVVIFHLNTAYSREIFEGSQAILISENPLYLGWWMVRMDLGVKVFFAISGFILAVPFVKYYWFDGKKVNIKEYFVRRLTRLEPPFIITLGLFFLVHLFVLNESFFGMFRNFLASLFYTHTIVFDRPSIINPVTWSLETEVQYYILIPVFAMLILFSKNKFLGITLILMLMIASIFFKSYVYTEHPYGWGSSVFVFLSNFLGGFLFAIFFMSKKHLFIRKSLVWDISGLFFLFTLFYFYKPQASAFNNIVFNGSVFMIFVSVFKGKIHNWFYTLQWVYLIGGMCYTIYLIHYPFFHLFVKFSKSLGFFENYQMNLLLQILVALPILILISSVFFILIEKPCMDKDWPQKLRLFFKKK